MDSNFLMSDETVNKIMERACRDCKRNFCANGYVLCETCLYGSPRRIPQEIVERWKEIQREEVR